jgi:hypothetical protein
MSLRTYKTNWLLWIVASLVILLLTSYDIQCVFALFTGEAKIAELMGFEFIAPLIIAVVIGWLVQCAIIIVFSWKQKDAKH